MTENTDNQIKSPLEKKSTTTTESVAEGVEKAIKKTLPKITKNTANAITTPIKKSTMFIGDSIKAGLNGSVNTISKGFDKLKDFGQNLLTDVNDLASDIISPGGLTTMLTGSPLLGALVGNKVEEAWDAAKDLVTDIEDNFVNVKNDVESSTDDNLVTSMDELNENTDITNDLLNNMLDVNNDFNKLYENTEEKLLKEKRNESLREKELEHERMDAIKKNAVGPSIINVNNEEQKESNFSKFFKRIKGTGSGILSSILMIGKLLARAVVTLTAVIAAFNGIYTFFNKLGDGASIKEALIAGLTDFVHVLTLGLVDKELINNLISFFVSPIYDFLAGIGKGLFNVIEGVWNTVAGLFTTDWERVKNGLFKFGEGIEGVFNSIINYFVDIVKSIFSIGEKIGGWFSKWFSDDDIKEHTKEQKEREKILENIQIKKSNDGMKPIIENSKQITQMQTPIQTTIINNNNNNMTQMSNNNAIGKTNMIISSSLRNMDPTFNQCLYNNMVSNM